MNLTAEQLAELIRRHPQPRRKKPPEPEPKVVRLVVANPEVPLERQRDRIAEATERLIADEVQRLRELQARDAWVANWQRAIDFHMEMIRANEEAEQQLRRSDPCGLWSKAR